MSALLYLLIFLVLLIYCCYQVITINKDSVNIYLWLLNLLFWIFLIVVSGGEAMLSAEEMVTFWIKIFLAVLAVLITTFVVKDIIYYLLAGQKKQVRKMGVVLVWALVGWGIIFAFYAILVTVTTHSPYSDMTNLIVN
ncbi:MAG: hypothetical protein WC570_00315 [Patescibacteria group bacterium]